MVKKFLSLSFFPLSSDLGLLVVRVLFGAGMAVLHGWPKLVDFSGKFHSFPDPLGVGSEVSYVLAVGAESVGAIFLVLGFYTRFAALSLLITMGVAYFIVHGGHLTGPGSGEMAAVYGAAYLALLFTGAGRYSLDAKRGIA
jgi:putative oxidoreductase